MEEDDDDKSKDGADDHQISIRFRQRPRGRLDRR